MSRVLIVARNTFREAVRDRVLYNLVFFALLMIASAVIVGQISMDIETIVMVSLGLSAISLIGLLIAVFTGVGLVSKEIDKRTLHAVLAKPLRRWEFLLGKFTGLVLTLTVNTAAMAAGLFLALWFVKHSLVRGDAVVLVAVETDASGGAGHDVFVLYVSAPGNPIYWRVVRGGPLRGAIAQPAIDADERAYAKVFLDTFLSAAKF